MRKKTEEQMDQLKADVAWSELCTQPEMIHRPTVRRIYSRYLQGDSVEDIRRYLLVNHNIKYSEYAINVLIDVMNAANL